MELVASYSRAQAIEDGQLIDITVLGRIAGFKLHTAITHAASGILGPATAVVSVLVRARKQAQLAGDTDIVEVEHGEHTLWLHIGPGDDAAPVLTLMLPSDW